LISFFPPSGISRYYPPPQKEHIFKYAQISKVCNGITDSAPQSLIRMKNCVTRQCHWHCWVLTHWCK
jgi:hypothetical protein